MIELNELTYILGAKRDKKRVGRGIGSGKGKTCGRGVKGQKARCGVAIKGFEGGQMPLIFRLPKRGFNPIRRFSYEVVNTALLQHLADAGILSEGVVCDKALLVEYGIVGGRSKVKLLANGELTSAVKVSVDAYSKAAEEAVTKVGGECIKKVVAAA